MIEFACGCGEPLAAAPEHAGFQVQCPRCQQTLTVPGPAKKRGAVVDDDDPPPAKKKAKLVDDDPPRRKKKRKRNYGDDDEPEHVKRLMAKANAELDEEEERHRKQGGGIAFTPGIIAGTLSCIAGVLLLVVMVCVGFFNFYLLVLCGLLIVGGLVRAVLSFLGQGTD